MNRRNFIAAGVAALAAIAEQSFAQQPGGRMPRVGILTPADNDKTPIFEAFKEGLRELGYVEGRKSSSNSVRTRRCLASPQLAAELVACRSMLS